MDNFLICMFDLRLVGKNVLRAQLETNPNLGFNYDFLHYEPSKSFSFKISNNTQQELTSNETALIENFINNYRYKVWPINSDGTCGNEIYIDQTAGPYAHCAPPKLDGNYWYNPNENQWDYIYGVDQNGKYLGNVPYVQCHFFANKPPDFDYQVWDNSLQSWVDKRSLDEVKTYSLNIFRNIANNARTCGTLFNGEVWESTPEALTALQVADPNTTSWKDMAGDVVQLSGYSLADIAKSIQD